MTDTKTVKIGDKTFDIQRFRALRAVLVMASLTRISQDVPDLVAKSAREYAETNKIVITEPMSKLTGTRWQEFTSEDFDKAEAATGKRQVEIPNQANGTESLLKALPELLTSTARREVVRLFAILLIPNDDLRKADKSDDVNSALDAYEDLILFEAELDELADIAEAATEAIRELDTRRNGKVGKLLRRVLTQASPGLTALLPVSESEQATTEDTETTIEGLTSPISTPDAPTSSTPSESPTDGVETPHSTEPLGVS